MQPVRAIMFKVGSVIVFIIMFALIKATAPRIPPGEAVFFRSFFALPIIVGWLMLRGELRLGVRTNYPLGNFWRALFGTLAVGSNFAALAILPLPEVTALSYAMPLLVVMMAALFLGEQVGIWRISAMLVGLVGVLIVLSPRLSVGLGAGRAELIGAGLALAAALFSALAQVTLRSLALVERTAIIVFWFSLNAALLSLLTLPFGWVVPGWQDAVLLVLAGLLGGIGQIFLTSSYRFGDASLVAPFEYASMLVALLIGYFVFAEVPTRPMLLGAALVIVAGIFIIWREKRRGIERGPVHEAATPEV